MTVPEYYSDYTSGI